MSILASFWDMSIAIYDVQQELEALAAGNEEYTHFNAKIVNTKKTVLGVRVPALRTLAKKLARDCTSDDIERYIDEFDPGIFEQVPLAGMLIIHAKLSDAEKIALAKLYLKFVDSWAEIDLFASKRKNFDEDLWWNFAIESLSSPHEFTVRYGVIELMANFLTDKYIKQVFEKLRGVKHDGYYVRTGLAWLYATTAVKYYDRTLREVQTSLLDIWTRKKSLTKMLESSQSTAPHPRPKSRDSRAT